MLVSLNISISHIIMLFYFIFGSSLICLFQVDTNVTRHLNNELHRDDWDLMVLHYLGLDHIGHIEGPKSSLIGPKLREMDDVIERLHTYLQTKVK